MEPEIGRWLASVGEAWRAHVEGYHAWFVRGAPSPSGHSYLALVAIATAFALLLERVRPFRGSRVEPRTARGLAYLFLNYFGFGWLGFTVVFDALDGRLASSLDAHGVRGVASLGLPGAAEVALYLVVRDLAHYGIHRVLHASPRLWRLHRLHHATTEMNVLAHFTYHPAEIFAYRALEAVPMALLGFSSIDFFVAHAIALVVGHLNHADVAVDYGPLRYVLNSPRMHLLHHMKAPPSPHGVNFGLTFSVWDFLFGTAYLPADVDPSTPLGFEGVERFPTAIGSALVEPLRRDRAR